MGSLRKLKRYKPYSVCVDFFVPEFTGSEKAFLADAHKYHINIIFLYRFKHFIFIFGYFNTHTNNHVLLMRVFYMR